MKGSVTLLVSFAAICLSACTVESGPDDGERVEAVGSELVVLAPLPPRPPKTPVLQTTLDIWRERCGPTMYPFGVLVPRPSWSCPSVPAGPGSFVGQDGRQWVAEALAEGLTEQDFKRVTPDVTLEMIYGLQPFCLYEYQYTPTTSVTSGRSPEINLAAMHLSTLESTVGPSAGPLCLPLSFPYPGWPGCPTCWNPFLVFDLPNVFPQ